MFKWRTTARCTTRDIDYYDTTIPAGSPVLLNVASANRDQRRYSMQLAPATTVRGWDHMPIVLS